MNSIVLIGFMGSGKTTLAKALKNDPAFCDMALIDTDAYIEETQGRKISDIFKDDGESYFRDIETKTLKEISKDSRPKIVSCGGGVVERKENHDILKAAGTVVYANASAKDLWARVGNDPKRPLSRDKEAFLDLYQRRECLYRNAADVIIDTGNNDVSECVGLIKKALGVS